MSERRLSTMSEEEFDVLIDRYIERGSQETDDLDADIFFEALADFISASVEPNIELNGKWDEGNLILSPEGVIPPQVEVHGNRIITPDFTFTIRLEQPFSQNGTSLAEPQRIEAVPLPEPAF